MPRTIYFGDNLPVLQSLESESVQLIYIDPPFNTGRTQSLNRMKNVQSESGARRGFNGRRYDSESQGELRYKDIFDDYLGFLEPRLLEAQRVLKSTGTIYVHLDYREVHYCRVMMDVMFGRENFLNEIIWAYDYGGRSKDRWPAKHDNILVYAKSIGQHLFNYDEVERIPYMAPGLVTPEKAKRGKLPTDTWWHTIVPTVGKERTGYPTQKPLGIIRRIISASSNPGDLVLDFFAGSGTTGEVCLESDREFVLVDSNPEAIDVMEKRFSGRTDIEWIGDAVLKNSPL
ncbi:MAG: site-specific DNA-methyltransferase [Chloroflexi bacterium]|nr:site-specific DNA-methyltransferase [Chloroflexota bacterium]